MPEEKTDLEQSQQTRSVSRELPGVRISRVIEYLPTGGNINIPRDCTYQSKSYSKGAVVIMADGASHECTGDKDGSWTRTSDVGGRT
jgi:uncharacterized protein DUF1496